MRKTLAFLPLLLFGGCQAPTRLDPSLDPKSAYLDPSIVHPVTPEMKELAAAKSSVPAPKFNLVGSDKKSHSLESFAGKPTLYYFINKDCPCCVDATPFVDRIAVEVKSAVNVVGILDGTAKDAELWAYVNSVKYLILADPDLAVIHAFGAKTGVYMAIVDENGVVVKLYPGYSQSGLQAIVSSLSSLARIKEPTVSFKGAPERSTSGCSFDDKTKR
ncbi:MAG: peroxiredoxin family protein [Armatimonadetes bacterium]|nr:peroxiredoxin family protein [Armatimonadota bacterium]